MSDRRIPVRMGRRDLTGGARQGAVPIDDETASTQPIQGVLLNRSFDLGMIGSRMCISRVEETSVEARLVREKKKSFAVEIETTKRIHFGRKAAGRQRQLAIPVRGELREHSVRFVEGQEHFRCCSFPRPKTSCNGLPQIGYNPGCRVDRMKAIL